MKHFMIAALSAAVLFTSCKKESVSDIQPGDKGELEIEFDNIVGDQNLILNTGNYTNAAGEAYTITTFKYYISNIQLKKTDGTTYTVTKDSSYFLVDESAPSQLITLDDIPAGDYSGLSFVVGVDSLKSTAPLAERKGVLDPAGDGADMYWTWNSGYIFLKMEGTSPVVMMADKKYYYHIGGFGGYSSPTINNIKTISLTAPAGMSAQVRKNKAEAPHFHLFADAAKVLNGPTNVSIGANSMVMFSPYSVNIANNYQSMFKIDHVHND